ncbi:GDSL-type esterase/lipase family protein [Niabella terrae]
MLLLIFLGLGIAAPVAAQKPAVRVACIGNSVTYGWGLQDRGRNSYPAVLQQRLGSGYQVENFGHSGATLLRKGHNPYYKTAAFQAALRFRPQIAVIHLGLNDTDPRNFPLYRDDFIPDYNWLIDTLQKTNPGIKIYICKMTPIFTGHPRFLSSTQNWYEALQQDIEQVARTRQLPLIDFHEALHNRPDLFTDAATLHPNRSGAAELARIVYQYLSGNFGGLQLPPVYTSNMVLQRDQPIRIQGLADAGSRIRIRWKEKTYQAQAGYNGKWQTELPAAAADRKGRRMEISDGSRRIRIDNILIGDVWLCAGQSNMYYPLSQSLGADSLIRHSDPGRPLRLFNYDVYAQTDNKAWSPEALIKANELDFFSGSWHTDGPAAAAAFSAVGYVFGQQLQSRLGVPVGLIEVAVGGSPLISWLSREALEKDPLFAPAFKNWRQSDYLMGWCRQRADENLKNTKQPYQRHSYEPAFNFEAAIEKLVPFPLKGIIWYQGESDAENAELYEKLFPLMVRDYRRQWHSELPFYYVQLSSIQRPGWNYFRDLQRRLLEKIPHSGMAVTSDLGDPVDVHYKDKIPVGSRLARLALHFSYHLNIVPSGPLFQRAGLAGDQINIAFKYSKGLRTSDGQALRGFEIQTARGEFLKVPAFIHQDRVYLQIPADLAVIKIAYGWQPFTRANLVNQEGLPASSFIYSIQHP